MDRAARCKVRSGQWVLGLAHCQTPGLGDRAFQLQPVFGAPTVDPLGLSASAVQRSIARSGAQVRSARAGDHGLVLRDVPFIGNAKHPVGPTDTWQEAFVPIASMAMP